MDALPFVSVVMPVRNEADFITRSVTAVLSQDYPRDRLEVIVADGRSTDGTREAIRELQARDPRLTLVDNPGGIVSTGLNAALALASGDIIVRVDGHCEIAPDYVRRATAHLLEGVAAGVGGPLATIGRTDQARAIAAAMSSPFGVGNSAFRTTQARTQWTDTVAFPAYTREWLRRAGPFDEELVRNQDDEYNYRLRAMGGRLLLAADVRATYYGRGTLRSLWRQYFQYGFWKVRVLQKHPAQMQPRQFVPPVFVGVLLLTAAGAPFSRPAALVGAATAAAYVGANLVATALVARRCRVRALATLSLAFAALHLAYGAGFLWGLLRFSSRWSDRSLLVDGERRLAAR